MAMVIEEIKEVGPNPPNLKVIGVGGGGGNAVNRMISAGLKDVHFIVANTDLQDIKCSLAPYKLQLGARCTRGLGAGAKPEVGREAAMEDMDAIRDYLTGADMVFITAGMGGGTGTGAAPVIAEIAREMNCLTVGVVTKPFKFEGQVRKRNGEEGIVSLRKHVDTLIVIPNDNLLTLANRKTSIVDAFSMADDVLRIAIQGISDLINNDGLINLDFADVRTVMSGMGQAIMGLGTGSGENRAIEAAEKAIHSPLLDNVSIDGAKGILINVTGPGTMTLHEVYEAASFIEDHADDEANIIFGATIDESMEDRLEITVIATGFGDGTSVGSADADTAERLLPRSPYKVFNSAPSAPLSGNSGDESVPEPLFQPKPFAPEPFQLKAGPGTAEPPEAPQAPLLPEEGVLELDDPILEPIETTPQIPSSYHPEEKRGPVRNGGGAESDLDIPTFIRRRSQPFSDE
ncbi:MAG: cell division protein FtsZ [bacterium]